MGTRGPKWGPTWEQWDPVPKEGTPSRTVPLVPLYYFDPPTMVATVHDLIERIETPGPLGNEN